MPVRVILVIIASGSELHTGVATGNYWWPDLLKTRLNLSLICLYCLISEANDGFDVRSMNRTRHTRHLCSPTGPLSSSFVPPAEILNNPGGSLCPINGSTKFTVSKTPVSLFFIGTRDIFIGNKKSQFCAESLTFPMAVMAGVIWFRPDFGLTFWQRIF